jgi:hypothetical protein
MGRSRFPGLCAVTCPAQASLLAGDEPLPKSTQIKKPHAAQQQRGRENVGRHTRVGRPRTNPETRTLSQKIVTTTRHTPDRHHSISDAPLVHSEAAGCPHDLTE